MRGLRRTVLGGLAVAVTAAGVLAPTAAQAATTAIGWETWGDSSLGREDTARICAAGDVDHLEQGQTVVVQALLAGAWTTRQEVLVGQWEHCVEVTPATLVAGPGRYSFRALFRPSPSAPVLEATATYTLEREQVESYPLDGSEQFSLTTTRGRSTEVGVYPAVGQRVDLQRKAGTRWVGVSTATAPTSATPATVKLPVPTRAGLSRYRFVVRATAWTAQEVGTSFTLHQTDVAKHRKYLVAARTIINRFCPGTPVYIDTPGVLPGNPFNAAGLATHGTYGDGTTRTYWGYIELRSGYKGKQLRHIATHECAHIVQGRAAVEDRYDLEMDRAWKLWPTTGHEGQADCMAWWIVRSTRDLYYVRGCSSVQRANAQRMWRAWGGRYQGATYTWTVPSQAATAVGRRVLEVHRDR